MFPAMFSALPIHVRLSLSPSSAEGGRSTDFACPLINAGNGPESSRSLALAASSSRTSSPMWSAVTSPTRSRRGRCPMQRASARQAQAKCRRSCRGRIEHPAPASEAQVTMAAVAPKPEPAPMPAIDIGDRTRRRPRPPPHPNQCRCRRRSRNQAVLTGTVDQVIDTARSRSKARPSSLPASRGSARPIAISLRNSSRSRARRSAASRSASVTFAS